MTSRRKIHIRHFDQLLSQSRSARELVDKMTVLHGELIPAEDRGTGRRRARTGRIVMSRLAVTAAGQDAIGSQR
jgi:hypothetical protein